MASRSPSTDSTDGPTGRDRPLSPARPRRAAPRQAGRRGRDASLRLFLVAAAREIGVHWTQHGVPSDVAHDVAVDGEPVAVLDRHRIRVDDGELDIVFWI